MLHDVNGEEGFMAKTSIKCRSATRKQPTSRDYTVTYKQGEFINCTADEVLWGGAAGPGKSYGQLIDAMYCAGKYPGIRQLILRESFPELKRSLIIKSLEIFPKDIMEYNAGDYIWYHINGSIIEFGYLDSDEGVHIYQSAEYDIIRIDESTHMSQYRITYMKSRIRGANNYPKQLKLTTNPGGTSHVFHKKHFKIGVNPPGQIFREYIGKDEYGRDLWETRCFIPARVYDNDFLLKANPNYVRNLMQLPDRERKALYEGRWDLNEDQAFPEFDYEIHVVNGAKLFPNGIPEHWKRWRSVDNGYDDPFAWYWFAVSEQGKVYIYREFTREKGDKATQIIERAQAKKVVEKSKHTDANGQEYEEKFAFTVAGHDAWASHHRDEQGKTLIDLYNEGGLYGFVKAVTDRRLRKSMWHEYLAPYEVEPGKWSAKLQIFDTCKKLIEYLPEAIKDPDDHEKYDEDGEWSHCLDGAGYGLIAYHASKSKAPKKEKTDLEKYHDRLCRNMKRKNRAR
jgi:hypothetical protein